MGAMTAALGGIGFAGTWSWNYMMHTNEFCSGCHIMAVPFQRFIAPLARYAPGL